MGTLLGTIPSRFNPHFGSLTSSLIGMVIRDTFIPFSSHFIIPNCLPKWERKSGRFLPDFIPILGHLYHPKLGWSFGIKSSPFHPTCSSPIVFPNRNVNRDESFPIQSPFWVTYTIPIWDGHSGYFHPLFIPIVHPQLSSQMGSLIGMIRSRFNPPFGS